ncbi:wax ester synthase/diacylglycerol acyltransferase 4-like [Rhododendron vialii]|uniref:wax ester synthase/diacylglycerol acyltransferase 4-like n=1 Tax=Rhododendron vialii TaxID=182163 RepID=UPI002660544D|nr:wax ester synthase/diacylglycerol acyltransferase 4-like [Rhododendron vialii]
MELEQEEEEPVSPTGQYFNSSVLSISVLGVLESQVPIDDSPTLSLLQDVFLPINPRFSSIMVRDKNGIKQWKRVKVNLKDHINVPIFPTATGDQFYDQQFNDYLTKISLSQLPQSRPLWEIHVIKYPTRAAAGHVVFKLHHALGDGFSIMGALLSCLQRADDPSLPLTFPLLRNDLSLNAEGGKGIWNAFSGFFNTVLDFGWSLMKSTFAEDDRTPIRSGDDGVEFRPVDIFTITFCLDQIKLIKSNLQVTINDVITGIIFYGTRLYMQETGQDHSTKSNSTALVLLNTRNISGYKSVEEMVKPDPNTKWGNQFGFIHVSIPELMKAADEIYPIKFVFEAQEIIKRKKNSAAVFLTGKLLETLRKYRGPEATARHIRNTLKNSSMTISNMVGPVEQMAIANHPCSGIYFMVVGVPQSLSIAMVSYMGKLRVAVGTEKGHIDPNKFKSCVQNSFDVMFKAAANSPSQPN